MPLKNYQYNKILREYDTKQLTNKHNQDTRIAEAYAAIPELKEIDDEVVTCAVSSAKLLLMGDGKPMPRLKKLTEQAEARRKALLEQHGFPEDYLQLKHHCPDCKDTGYIGNEKCHCFKQAIVDIVYSQSNIKTAIVRENFNTFSYDYYSGDYTDPSVRMSPRENIKKVVEICRNFIDNFGTEYNNLLLYGNTGVGKTFLANCVARELLDRAFTVIYLTAFQLFDILEKNKFAKGEESYEFQNQFDYILDCDLLIIDDLGTELNNSFVNVQLYLCINERFLRRKSTIISTNLSLDNINTIYSERVFSRIASNYSLLKIVGEDIRLKKLF
ncbi:DNA replication protein DnaC [Anaerocolumna cellulosilytica]|uniref:DNA replication protein DnaC n=1 Tax=Anaerocolumna cellulosilytica TaxID=433286 RepID=A0A6S6QZU8_9FIRM|nr:ATP-binding protein [Anaerocolumna cellulosilytica]MBB5196980.1 DNA replication protein DnaC [Anaerocolumna cellulosilytica]BCJ92620.1 DNA replication protein DnaC [Anaerocolumna cellulosilytica]